MLGLGETRAEVGIAERWSVDRAVHAGCAQRRDRRDYAGPVLATQQKPLAGEAVCDAGGVRGVEEGGERDGVPVCGERSDDPKQLSRWR